MHSAKTFPATLAGLAVVVAIAASGCAQQAPSVVPTATPTPKPVFATDAEALAAARKAYEAYLKVSDQIARDGGSGIERLRPLDTPSQFLEDKKELLPILTAHQHITGHSTFYNFSLKDISAEMRGHARVSAYVCLDVSKIALWTAAGVKIDHSDNEVLPLEISFSVDARSPNRPLLDGSTEWTGNTFC